MYRSIELSAHVSWLHRNPHRVGLPPLPWDRKTNELRCPGYSPDGMYGSSGESTELGQVLVPAGRRVCVLPWPSSRFLKQTTSDWELQVTLGGGFSAVALAGSDHYEQIGPVLPVETCELAIGDAKGGLECPGQPRPAAQLGTQAAQGLGTLGSQRAFAGLRWVPTLRALWDEEAQFRL